MAVHTHINHNESVHFHRCTGTEFWRAVRTTYHTGNMRISLGAGAFGARTLVSFHHSHRSSHGDMLVEQQLSFWHH